MTNAADTAISAATSRVGEPYLYGGNAAAGPTDCSGLIQWAYAKAGVQLPRTAGDQHHATPEVGGPPLPGDLLFYDNDDHVTMVVGPGVMIEDPHTGASVRVVPIRTGWDAHTRPADVGTGAVVSLTAATSVASGSSSAWSSLAKASTILRVIEVLVGAGLIVMGLVALQQAMRRTGGPPK